MKATVTSKGQITIPLPIRRRLRIEKGSVLELHADDDRIEARKSVDRERMRSVIGIGRNELAGKSLDQWMEEIRGPAQPPRRTRRSPGR